MLADRYEKEQAELTENIEQYEREGRSEHDQLDKIQECSDEVSKYACLLYTSALRMDCIRLLAARMSRFRFPRKVSTPRFSIWCRCV